MPGNTGKTMMHRASSLFGLTALVLMGSGAGTAVRAEDDTWAKHLCDQLTPLVSVPVEPVDGADPGPADDDWLAGVPEPAMWLSAGPDQAMVPIVPDTQPALQADDQPADAGTPRLQPTVTSWTFSGDNRTAEVAPAQSFLLDLPSEGESAAPDTDLVYETSAERSTEPHDFRINDRLKVKAQPLGGGLGGRVTLTFSFDSGY